MNNFKNIFNEKAKDIAMKYNPRVDNSAIFRRKAFKAFKFKFIQTSWMNPKSFKISQGEVRSFY